MFGQTGFVTVQDTMYLADGVTPFTGTLAIKWPTFTLNGKQIGLGSMNVQVANGALKVALWPSDQALIFNPDNTGQYGTGFLYQVSGTTPTSPIVNFWLVPSSAQNTTVTLNSVSTLPSGAAGPSGLQSGTLAGIPSVCAVGAALYQATDQPVGLQIYACTATNIWTRAPYAQGASNPGTCSVGQIFFNTSATAGSNLYLCTATNTFTQVTGGSTNATTVNGAAVPASQSCVGTNSSSQFIGASCTGTGASFASQLGDFIATNTSGTVQTLGAGCSTSTPCQVRIGNVSFVMTAPVTATISGTSSFGTVYWYLSSNQVLTAGYSSATTLTCSSGCSTVTGVTAFPWDSTPLWQTTFTTSLWDTINVSAMDKRSIISRDIIAPGSGISSASNTSTGVQTLSTDPTQVPRYFVGSGAPGINCTLGRDFYTDSTGHNSYFCSATNTWTQGNGGGGTDRQTFLMVSNPSNGAPNILATDTNMTEISAALSGPNSISAKLGTLQMTPSDWVIVSKKLSSTWTPAAGSIDVSFSEVNLQGAPNAGTSWRFTIYLGCAAAGANFTYGVGTQITVTPGSAGLSVYGAVAGVNTLAIPASCTAGVPIQAVIQRNSDAKHYRCVCVFIQR